MAVVQRHKRVEKNLKRVRQLLELVSGEVEAIGENAPDKVEYGDYYHLLEIRGKLADILGIDDYDPPED
jgi:hypothetical protein